MRLDNQAMLRHIVACSRSHHRDSTIRAQGLTDQQAGREPLDRDNRVYMAGYVAGLLAKYNRTGVAV